MLKSARIPWLLLALLFFLGATPEHPGHMVQPDRIQATAADAGRFLQVVGGKAQWSDGVPVPLFIKNASTSMVTGLPVIARDLNTGVLTLPSAPTPATSLELYCNGIRQQWGVDFTLNGAVVTPALDAKGVFINSVIVGDWHR